MSYHLLSIAALTGLVGAGAYAMSGEKTTDLGLPTFQQQSLPSTGSYLSELSKIQDSLGFGKRTTAMPGSGTIGSIGKSMTSAYDYVVNTIDDTQSSLDDAIASVTGASKRSSPSRRHRKPSSNRR